MEKELTKKQKKKYEERSQKGIKENTTRVCKYDCQ